MKIIQYLKDTKAELAHVNWPSRRESIMYTVVVAVISLGVGAFLGVSDYVFGRLLALIIS